MIRTIKLVTLFLLLPTFVIAFGIDKASLKRDKKSIKQENQLTGALLSEMSDFYRESGKIIADIEANHGVPANEQRKSQLKVAKQQVTERKQQIEKIYKRLKKARGDQFYVPERWENKIIIGIDEDIYVKYLEYEQIEKFTKIISKYLERHTNMDVELWKLRPEDLEDNFHRGELDIIATYNPSVRKSEFITRVLTPIKHGKNTQRCLLVTHNKSDIKRIEDLTEKTIAVLDSHIKNNIDVYFGNNFGAKSLLKIAPNNRAAIMGLQMGEYDAIIGYENLLTASRHSLNVIAQSLPIENRSLYMKQSKNEEKNREMDQLLKCLKKAHRDRKMRKLLALFDMDALVDSRRKQVPNEKKY